MDADYWFPVLTLILGAGLGYLGQSRQSAKQHERTVELTEKQHTHARQQDERQHQNHLDVVSRAWLRDKAFELVVALNELQDAVREYRSATSPRLPVIQDDILNRTEKREASLRMYRQIGLCNALTGLLNDQSLANTVRGAISRYWQSQTPKGEQKSRSDLMADLSALMDAAESVGEYARSL